MNVHEAREPIKKAPELASVSTTPCFPRCMHDASPKTSNIPGRFAGSMLGAARMRRGLQGGGGGWTHTSLASCFFTRTVLLLSFSDIYKGQQPHGTPSSCACAFISVISILRYRSNSFRLGEVLGWTCRSGCSFSLPSSMHVAVLMTIVKNLQGTTLQLSFFHLGMEGVVATRKKDCHYSKNWAAKCAQGMKQVVPRRRRPWNCHTCNISHKFLVSRIC